MLNVLDWLLSPTPVFGVLLPIPAYDEERYSGSADSCVIAVYVVSWLSP